MQNKGSLNEDCCVWAVRFVGRGVVLHPVLWEKVGNELLH